MPLIPLDTETARGVELLACAWGVSPAEAIRRLLADLVSEQTPGPSPRDRPVPVYAVYARTCIDAEFHPASGAVATTSGPGRGFYRTPSGASAAVIQALHPMVKPNRTGWQFWHVVQTNAPWPVSAVPQRVQSQRQRPSHRHRTWRLVTLNVDSGSLQHLVPPPVSPH